MLRIPHKLALAAIPAAFMAASISLLAARAQSQAKDGAELRRIENRWLARENDPRVLQGILADDFVHVLPQGFIGKTEQIAYLRRRPVPEAPTTRRFEQMRVRVYGDIGIVNGIVVATPARGATRRTIFTDVFARRNGRWQAVNAQEDPFVDAAKPSAARKP